MFVPGETITHRFYIPFISHDVDRIYITYYQDGRVILTKNLSGQNIQNKNQNTGGEFTLTLKQEDSLLFKDDTQYRIQLNVVLKNGARCTSQEIWSSNGRQHIKERL